MYVYICSWDTGRADELVWFPDPSCMGRARGRRGRKGLVNNSTLFPMRIHGSIPAVSVDEEKMQMSSLYESWIATGKILCECSMDTWLYDEL